MAGYLNQSGALPLSTCAKEMQDMATADRSRHAIFLISNCFFVVGIKDKEVWDQETNGTPVSGENFMNGCVPIANRQ